MQTVVCTSHVTANTASQCMRGGTVCKAN